MTHTNQSGPQLDLLRNEDLLHLARNESAQYRNDAIRILVERGSHYAAHEEIAHLAAGMIYAEPKLLKNADANPRANKLPGLLDVLSNEHARITHLQATIDKVAAHLREKEEALRGMTELLKAKDETIQTLCGQIENRVTLLETSAEHRLGLLERPLWRKISDWLRKVLKLDRHS